LSEREEIELLLPWYVTGRLAAADRARVESHLAAHPEMRSRLELIGEEQAADIAVNEAIVLPKSLAVHTTAARIAAAERASPRGVLRAFAGAARGFFKQPTPGAVRFAAAAAAAIILVQGALIGAMFAGRDGASYQTASGGTSALEGSFAIVRFADVAGARAIAEFLAAQKLAIVDGPKPGGLFVVRIGPKTMGGAEREQVLQLLRGRNDLVTLVMAQ
jgi:anti-sigma factor RsiW